MGMKCESCGSTQVFTKDSRLRVTTKYVYRNKYCQDCGAHFSTMELPSKEFYRLLDSDEKLSRIKEFVENYKG